jgi:hypothetical protein
VEVNCIPVWKTFVGNDIQREEPELNNTILSRKETIKRYSSPTTHLWRRRGGEDV